MTMVALRVVLLAWLLGSLVPAAPAVAAWPIPLLDASPPAAGDAQRSVPSYPVVRQREVSARPGVLIHPDGSSALAVGDRVALNLFGDVNVTMTVTDVTSFPGAGRAWSGTLDGVDLGSAVLVVHDGALVGRVATPNAVYRIGYAPDGTAVVEEIDTAALPPEGPSIVPPPSGADAMRLGGETLESVGDTAAQIDVMVLYTAAARAAAGGTTAMRAEAALAVTTTNQAYANNNLAQRLRLVFTGEFALSEGSFNSDLVALLAALRANPIVGWLRDTTRADFVSLLVQYGAGAPFCGRGFQLRTNSTSFAPNAYSVVERSCASSNLSFPHELGHNMGANHDAFVIGTDTGLAPYSQGWVDLVGHFRTIMGYNDRCAAQMPPFNCTRLQFFSTPNQTQGGRPLGDAATADNVRTLSETADTVSNFRQALSPPLTVTTGVNQPSFAAGQTLVLSAGLDNPGSTPGAVDIYVGLLFPDGAAVFFTDVTITPTSGYALGNILNYGSYRAIATGVPLAGPFAVNAPTFLAYPWGGSEPKGGFTFFMLVLTAGALADGTLSASELRAASLSPFTFP